MAPIPRAAKARWVGQNGHHFTGTSSLADSPKPSLGLAGRIGADADADEGQGLYAVETLGILRESQALLDKDHFVYISRPVETRGHSAKGEVRVSPT